LPICSIAGTYSDDRDGNQFRESCRHHGRDRLEDEREAARLLKLDRFVQHTERCVRRAPRDSRYLACLKLLGCQTDVSHHGNACCHNGLDAIGDRSGPLHLHRMTPGLDKRLAVSTASALDVSSDRNIADQEWAARVRGGRLA
jgi:hypothetical protein